ncbi:MAG: hypothetical protein WBL19_01630 [Minisyncoccia bacterium]
MKEGHKKVGIIAVSFTVVEALNFAFDFITYPLAIGYLGATKGGAIMTVLALGLNYGLVVFYNKTNRDWFGFEWLRLQKQEEAKSGPGRILRHILHFGHWPAYVFLSWQDPFKAFVFVRGRKAVGEKFNKADWAWFFGTNLLGNLIWIVIVSGAIELIKRLI